MSVTFTDFELPNAGAGPDPYGLGDRAASSDLDAIVLLFQRDYHCRNCRDQVQAVADRYDEFEARNAEVVSILPESLEKAAAWQDTYDLPFPLLADEDKGVGDRYDQPTRFGILGSLHDMLGRMPQVVILDVRSGDPSVHYVHEGSAPADRPEIEDLLGSLDDLQ